MTKELENGIRTYLSVTRARGQSVDIGTIYNMMSHPLKVNAVNIIMIDFHPCFVPEGCHGDSAMMCRVSIYNRSARFSRLKLLRSYVEI